MSDIRPDVMPSPFKVVTRTGRSNVVPTYTTVSETDTFIARTSIDPSVVSVNPPASWATTRTKPLLIPVRFPSVSNDATPGCVLVPVYGGVPPYTVNVLTSPTAMTSLLGCTLIDGGSETFT